MRRVGASQMDRKQTGRKILSAASIVVIAFCIIGTLIASVYSVNQSDDYSHAMEIGRFHENFFTYLATSIVYMGRMYMGWAGNFFSMFLQGWLSPLNNCGAPQLGIVMFINAALFFGVFIWLIMFAARRMFATDRTCGLVITALVLFALMNYRCYYEIFYWFSGAVSYSFPLVFMYLSFILGIMSLGKEKKGRGLYIAALITGFLGAGGSLTLSGTGCFCYFLLAIYTRIAEGKLNKRTAGLFISVFAATLINVAAPGNLVRTQTNGTGLSLMGAVKSTVSSTYTEYRWLFHDTSFLIIVFAFIFIGILNTEKVRLHRSAYYTTSVLALFAPPVAILPVVMGYGMNFLANRTLFVIDQVVYLSLLNGALCLGTALPGILREKRGENSNGSDDNRTIKHIFITLIAASAVFLCTNNYALRDMESVRTLLCDLNGTFSTYHDECAKLEAYFGSCEGMDVIVDPSDVPEGPPNFSCLYLENSWVNEGIAAYYKMNSLTLAE